MNVRAFLVAQELVIQPAIFIEAAGKCLVRSESTLYFYQQHPVDVNPGITLSQQSPWANLINFVK